MAYYAVARGCVPGVYLTWDDCWRQVDGWSNNMYQKFDTLGLPTWETLLALSDITIPACETTTTHSSGETMVGNTQEITPTDTHKHT